jgi:hypothetical protein
MPADRRQSFRSHVLRRARIVFRRGHSVLDCIVLDLAPGGARLKVAEWLGLPERFELRIENGPAHEVEVRHRSMEITGVEFVDARAG